MEQLKRKGARTVGEIPPAIRTRLNRGETESVNLTEWLAVDHAQLIEAVLPAEYRAACRAEIGALKPPSVMATTRAVGRALCRLIEERQDKQLFERLVVHPSDSVRCWAACVVGADARLDVEQKLERIRPFAADPHFGVREIAWMALREELAANLERVIPILEIWSRDADENIRRFSSEAIRPNGVWCWQIAVLKADPAKALGILENLRADPSRYVEESVGNWLNDASKTRPQFVRELCARWLDESSSPATAYIVKRALRTINK